MKISYKKLWVLLIERDIPKSMLRGATQLSPGTISKLSRAWLQHMIWHLAPNGRIGMVLANGSLSSQSGGENEKKEQFKFMKILKNASSTIIKPLGAACGNSNVCPNASASDCNQTPNYEKQSAKWTTTIQ